MINDLLCLQNTIQDLGVIIFQLGAGHNVELKELKIVATDDNYVFLEKDFQQMVIGINQVAKMICKSKTLVQLSKDLSIINKPH